MHRSVPEKKQGCATPRSQFTRIVPGSGESTSHFGPASAPRPPLPASDLPSTIRLHRDGYQAPAPAVNGPLGVGASRSSAARIVAASAAEMPGTCGQLVDGGGAHALDAAEGAQQTPAALRARRPGWLSSTERSRSLAAQARW